MYYNTGHYSMKTSASARSWYWHNTHKNDVTQKQMGFVNYLKHLWLKEGLDCRDLLKGLNWSTKDSCRASIQIMIERVVEKTNYTYEELNPSCGSYEQYKLNKLAEIIATDWHDLRAEKPDRIWCKTLDEDNNIYTFMWDAKKGWFVDECGVPLHQFTYKKHLTIYKPPIKWALP